MRDLDRSSTTIREIPEDHVRVRVAIRCIDCGKRARLGASSVFVHSDPKEAVAGWDGVYVDRIFTCSCGAVDRYEIPARELLALRMRAAAAAITGEGPVRVGCPELWDGSVHPRPSLGLRHLEEVTRRHPRSGAAWRRLGNLHRRLAQPDAAERAWRRALAVDEDEFEAAVSLATLSFDGGAPTAVDDVNAALMRIGHPRSAPSHVHEALALQLASLLQSAADGCPGAALEVAWGTMPTGDAGDSPVIALSGVRLRPLERWDRLAELLASGLVLSARFQSHSPARERTELERLLDSDVPLSDWAPSTHASPGRFVPIAIEPPRPRREPLTWRSASKKRRRRAASR